MHVIDAIAVQKNIRLIDTLIISLVWRLNKCIKNTQKKEKQRFRSSNETCH